MNVDPVRELEQAFLPRLHAARDFFAGQFPAFEFNVWSSPTGSLTSYKGHDIGLECIFPDAPRELANCVAITIGVKHLTTAPLLCDASVGWGDGWHPDISLDLLPDPIAYSATQLNVISGQLDELVSAFQSAVQAGPGRPGA